MLRSARLSGKTSEYQPALMLPEVRTLSQPASLLTPILLFERGAELQLHHAENDIRVMLTKREQQTGSFAQFRFESRGKVQKAVAVEQEPPSQEEKGGLSINWDDL
jgi:hypothetical protein